MPKTLTPLHELAHARAGDKGNRLNISLIAYRPEIWPTLVEEVTEACVAQLFATRGVTRVQRFLLPNLHAMNFVLDDVLEGGVNGSLNLDTHGKTLSFCLLSHQIFVPEHIRGVPEPH
ncbi:hypothetical protein [Castellaniella sp.]|uniref:AtuA-related protein n=1 Tax=Castellaniella sp. TaxID=1955812 RepID=UPI003A8F841B